MTAQIKITRLNFYFLEKPFHHQFNYLTYFREFKKSCRYDFLFLKYMKIIIIKNEFDVTTFRKSCWKRHRKEENAPVL
jgi:hypothetical protein